MVSNKFFFFFCFALTMACTAPASGQEGVLRLENVVEVPVRLYPGQDVKLGYRIYYKNNIVLTREELPLLEAEGFLKVGEKEFKEYEERGVFVQEIIQKMRALQSGTYVFPPSVIEGKVYEKGLSGKLLYREETLASKTPALEVIVRPFPEKGRPLSFEGAIGQFKLGVQLMTPSHVRIGERMELKITISGTGEFHSVSLPDIFCQPGFGGFFQLDDFPPLTELKSFSKSFLLGLRPVTSFITQIPSLEFSFFDPTISTYRVLHSEAIPLTVDAVEEEMEGIVHEQALSFGGSSKAFEDSLAGKEMEKNDALEEKDLEVPFWHTSRGLPLVLFSIVLLIWQYQWNAFLKEEKKKTQPLRSVVFWKKAKRVSKDPSSFFYYLEKALLVALKEAGYVTEILDIPEKLPQEGIPGEVRQFLSRVAQERFSGKPSDLVENVMREGENLLQKVWK